MVLVDCGDFIRKHLQNDNESSVLMRRRALTKGETSLYTSCPFPHVAASAG
jgi:hypothetical protein